MEKLEEIIDIMDELNIKGNIIIDPYWSEKSYSLDIEDLDGWVSSKEKGIGGLLDTVLEDLRDDYKEECYKWLDTHMAIDEALERDGYWRRD